jgi:NAD(P)-dependent dehydrogenase (short-subunit alcohol dehydrogenase family)
VPWVWLITGASSGFGRTLTEAAIERGDPVAALTRVLIAAWRHIERYHALVAINTQLPQAELRRRHRPVSLFCNR